MSPSFFIFSAAISACLTSSISSQVARRIPTDAHFGGSLSSLHPGCRTFLPRLLRGIILLNSSVPFPHLLCSTQQYHRTARKSRENREKFLVFCYQVTDSSTFSLAFLSVSFFRFERGHSILSESIIKSSFTLRRLSHYPLIYLRLDSTHLVK